MTSFRCPKNGKICDCCDSEIKSLKKYVSDLEASSAESMERCLRLTESSSPKTSVKASTSGLFFGGMYAACHKIKKEITELFD